MKKVRHYLLLLLVWSFGLSFAQSFGYQPKGTEILELRTENSRHYSNGDGTIRAVIEGRDSVPPIFSGFSELAYLWGSLYQAIKHTTPVRGAFFCGYWGELYPQAWIWERGWVEWDISSIPDAAQISNVICRVYRTEITGTYPGVRLYQMTNRPSGPADAVTLYNDAGDGNLYGEFSSTSGWNSITLSQSARTDLQSRLADNWFAIGFTGTGPTTGVLTWEIGFCHHTGSYPPKLIVDYSLPYDVGVTKVLSPTGTIDSGQVITPACSVYNFGTNTVSYNVRMKIGNFYDQTVSTPLHSPGQLLYLSFPSYASWPRGNYLVSCSTQLSTDLDRSNDRCTSSVAVRVRDVGCTHLLAPTGTIDSGQVITPACSVYNFGTTTENYSVRLRVGDFSTTGTVSSHSPQTRLYLTFPTINADWLRGNHSVSCSTELATDANPENDEREGQITVRVYDVGCLEILSPSGAIDSQASIEPSARIKNFGTETANNFSVEMEIGTWTDTKEISSLEPDRETILVFTPWQPRRGTFPTKCSTQFSSDLNGLNNKSTGSVTVYVRDVGCTNVLSPTGTIDSGQVITPACSVCNFGTEAVAYSVRMKIGSFYDQTVFVSSHPPGELFYLTFPIWEVREIGTHSVSCSTELSSDLNLGNDKSLGEVTVLRPGVRDVGVESLLRPAIYESPGPLVPMARVRNYGSNEETFKVYFWIYLYDGGLVYSDSQSVSLLPDSSRLLDFREWSASIGLYLAKCSTALDGDVNLENDAKGRIFLVEARIYDVGVTEILRPRGVMAPGPIRPRGKVYNYGRYPEDFKVYFAILSEKAVVYFDSSWVRELYPGSEGEVIFPEWQASVGNYTTKCSTALPTDQNPLNDKAVGWVRIEIPTSGWILVGSVPVEPDKKRIKSGGGLTRCGDKLYILKGNNTRSLYEYIPGEGSARFLDSVPLGAGKKVKKGGAITSDGSRFLYIAKGANTKEIWRYDTEGESGWQFLPPFPGEKGLKGGTGIGYLSGYLYLLKGGKTNEFYRFNLSTADWETPRQPSTENGFKDGSCLVVNNESLLFVLQGNYNNFYAYNVRLDSWQRKSAMPLYHPQGNRKKKVKEGAVMTVKDGSVFAFKGGNTNEFWFYDLEKDSWFGRDTLPKGNERKRVKGGSGLASFGDEIWALKGNNTSSIWKYTEGFNEEREKPRAESGKGKEKNGMRIVQGPISSGKVYYHLFQKGRARIRIYNTLGKIVYSNETDKGDFFIDARRLPVGVYIIQFEWLGDKEVEKLIVVR